MNYDSLKNIFGAEAAQRIATLLEQKESLNWPMRQVLTLCEGYPADTSTQQFAQADRLNDVGWTCHTMGEYEEALEHYGKALELCCDFPMVWNNKGLAHFRLGQFDEAKQAYERAIAINPLFIKPFSNMGILYYELRRDREQARAWFLKALTLDPNYQRARAYLDRIVEETEHTDVLMIGTDPDLAGGLIEAFKKKGVKAKWMR